MMESGESQSNGAERTALAIIGAGAAGLIAAVSALRAGERDVTVFESQKKCGSKILASGGARCNLTNSDISELHYCGGSRNFIKNVLRAFGRDSALKFFREIGVDTYLEGDNGKYFPVTDKASSVVQALLHEARSLGVEIKTNTNIESINVEDGRFILSTAAGKYSAGRLIIAAGGKSYPRTGSTGDGFRFALSLGHKVVPPRPALSPVLLSEPELQSLAGLTIPCSMIIREKGKEIFRNRESLLFTHSGISGPLGLNASRIVSSPGREGCRMMLNFLDGRTKEEILHELKAEAKSSPQKLAVSFFRERLPNSLCSALFRKAGIGESVKFSSLSNQAADRIASEFTECTLKYTGVKGFDEAEVTAGGVDLSELKYQTMESRIVPGLYFAGEVCDVDGDLGGYNFQWAWSSGYLAGTAAAYL